MDKPLDDVDAAIGQRLQQLRMQRGLSLAALADVSGVSKAMISRVERAESSATAALLGRLAAGLGVPLSQLVAPPPQAERLHRRAAQPLWQAPGGGWCRRRVAPPDATGVELVEVELPAGTRVPYPPWQGAAYPERVWLLQGRLQVDWGEDHFDLAEGDCLDIAVDRAITFATEAGCRYLLVVGTRGGTTIAA